MIKRAVRLARQGRLDIDAWVRALASEYLAVQVKLENMVIAAFLAGDHKTKTKRQAQLRKLHKELDDLGIRSSRQTRRIAREGYLLGERVIKTNTDEGSGKGQPVLRREAIQLLEDNLNHRLGDARKTVGRRVEDVFRREGLRASAFALQTDNENLFRAEGRFRERLMREGITAFQDSRGRKWDLNTYAEMHIRTTVTDAMNMGADSALSARGLDIVEIVSGETACSKCDPYVKGGPWSNSGASKNFPKLAESPSYHPKCDCVKLASEKAFAERAEQRELVA